MWYFDNTTIELANNLFPTELQLLSPNEWATYMRTNKELMMALLVFWADLNRCAVYRNNGLTSWPVVSVGWSNIGNVQRIDPVSAIRLNYLISNDDISNNTVKAFRTAADVQRATTNYRTKYIGYS